MKTKKRRISVVCWHDGYRYVFGRNWAGNYQNIFALLSDMKHDGNMREDAFIVRLPRRFEVDYMGRIYKSREDFAESVLNSIKYGSGYGDKMLC